MPAAAVAPDEGPISAAIHLFRAARGTPPPLREGKGCIMKDGKHVILCVDDDPDILQTLRMVLEKNGYHMVGAASAEEAISKYNEAKPDLLIVDLMMEQVDSGAGLVRKLKEMGNQAPSYMLSSVGDEMNATIDSAELGLSGVFQKPIDPKVLVETIRTRLA
ncbi:MAG: response regulator transcription factor [Myxococcales bacterium]